MKKKIAKLLALGMSIALVFSLAACGGTDEVTTTEDTTPAAFVVDDGEAASGDAAPSEDASAADPSETGSANNGTGNNGTGTGTQTPSESGVKVPTNVAEVVSLYNSAVAKSGFTKGNLQRTWVDSKALGQELNTVSGGQVKPLFEKPETISVTPGSISEGDISQAGAKSQGNSIILTIKLKNVTAGPSDQHGFRSYPYFITASEAAALVNSIAVNALNLDITFIQEGSSFALSNGILTATVDKSTGKMTALNFTFDEEVNGKAKYGIQVDAMIKGSGVVDFK